MYIIMNRIKIISNTQYKDLYEISKSFYVNLVYEKLEINGENSFYSFDFLNYIIMDDVFKDIDIMVYIDEDCFITDIKALERLIFYFTENDIDCIGMPDGGVVSTRTHNPLSINQFFCILNLKKIREKYNLDEVLKTLYSDDLSEYLPSFLIKGVYNLDNFEPYYKLFFWMLKNKYKFYYLDAKNFDLDTTTTILKNHENIEFAYHTWYARNWIKDEENTKRILNVINHCKKIIK